MVIAGMTYQLVQNDSARRLGAGHRLLLAGLHHSLLTDVDPADFLWAWTTNPHDSGQTFNPPDAFGWNTNGALLVGNDPFFNRLALQQQTQ